MTVSWAWLPVTYLSLSFNYKVARALSLLSRSYDKPVGELLFQREWARESQLIFLVDNNLFNVIIASSDGRVVEWVRAQRYA